MIDSLTLIKSPYGGIIKDCQTHLYHLEGSSPQERMALSWKTPQASAPIQTSEGLILLVLYAGDRDSRSGGPAAFLSHSFILFSKLALGQIQRATEMRNKRLVSSKKDVETELHLPPGFRTSP